MLAIPQLGNFWKRRNHRSHASCNGPCSPQVKDELPLKLCRRRTGCDMVKIQESHISDVTCLNVRHMMYIVAIHSNGGCGNFNNKHVFASVQSRIPNNVSLDKSNTFFFFRVYFCARYSVFKIVCCGRGAFECGLNSPNATSFLFVTIPPYHQQLLRTTVPWTICYEFTTVDSWDECR